MYHPHHIDRFESMLFNAETTARTDFHNGEIKPITQTVYEGKSSCLRKRPRPLKDLHSLTDWKVANVPFSLFIKPHEILHNNPWKIQEPYLEPPNIERPIVQKTRPRIIMTPFVSMDDFEGPEGRQRLVDNFYTSETMRTSRQVLESTRDSIKAPLPTGLPAPANPITIPHLTPPYVSPEWRMETVTWDNKQLRTYCNPTREFWLARTPKCLKCDETAAVNKMKKMKRH